MDKFTLLSRIDTLEKELAIEKQKNEELNELQCDATNSFLYAGHRNLRMQQQVNLIRRSIEERYRQVREDIRIMNSQKSDKFPLPMSSSSSGMSLRDMKQYGKVPDGIYELYQSLNHQYDFVWNQYKEFEKVELRHCNPKSKFCTMPKKRRNSF